MADHRWYTTGRHLTPLLEDYILLLKTPSLDALRGRPFAHFRRELEDTLAPQMQIARTMGFAAGWSYAPV